MQEYPLSALGKRFHSNNAYLSLIVKDFEENDWYHRPFSEINPAIWVVGHIATSRRSMLRLIGIESPVAEWENLFARGTTPDETQEYPPAKILLTDFKASGNQIADNLMKITPEESDKEIEWAAPGELKTLEGALHFLYFHEVYHLGQLGMIRKLCGKERFA